MGCRKTWNREFMMGHMPNTWMNGPFKKRQENLMLQAEKSLLPATQAEVTKTINERAIRASIKKLKAERAEVNKCLSKIREDLETMEGNLYRTIRRQDIPFNPEMNVVHGACPLTNCKGFLGDEWKCKLCNVAVCNKCRMECKKDHVCKPEDVESAKFLQKDAKPCPNCTALCHKVDGCAQVFCINCKTAFNYKTLMIENGHIHAPDYYRWVRSTGGALARDPGDVPCGGGAQRLVRFGILRNTLHQIDMMRDTARDILFDMHMLTTHVKLIEIPAYQTNALQDNVDIRVQYMMNEIDEAKWKRLLQQRNKAREKKQEIHAVLDTFVTVASDLFENVVQCKEKSDVEGIIGEFQQLKEYINNRLQKISTIFNCVVPNIGDHWKMIIYKS
jgi:hypothetical protein